MEIKSIDRTNELEQRLKAIVVNSEDTCIFYKNRENALFYFKRCYYCTYYSPDDVKNSETGLCKFKRR